MRRFPLSEGRIQREKKGKKGEKREGVANLHLLLQIKERARFPDILPFFPYQPLCG